MYNSHQKIRTVELWKYIGISLQNKKKDRKSLKNIAHFTMNSYAR